MVTVGVAVGAATVSAVLGGTAGAAIGGAMEKTKIQNGLKDRLIERLTIIGVPSDVIDQIRDMPINNVITYIKSAIDTALAHVTDTEARGVLLALKDFMQQHVE